MRTICTDKNATGAKRWRSIHLEKLKGGKSGRDQNRQIQRYLPDRIVQRAARFGLAATTAIGAARAGLQLGEAPHAVGSSATDIVVSNGVAQTDVHGVHFQRECE
jgi:hypothetical protein